MHTIYISPKTYLKLKYYAKTATGEISGWGLTERKGKNIIIKEIYLLEQEATGSTTEIDKEALAKLIDNLSKKGIDPANLNLWWHTHADFSTFWSGTDENNIAQFTNTKYLVSVVVNKKMESKARIDIFNPFVFTIDAKLKLKLSDTKLKKEIEKEVKQKVKEPTSGVEWVGSGKHKEWNSSNWWKRQQQKQFAEEISRLGVAEQMTDEEIEEFYNGRLYNTNQPKLLGDDSNAVDKFLKRDREKTRRKTFYFGNI